MLGGRFQSRVLSEPETNVPSDLMAAGIVLAGSEPPIYKVAASPAGFVNITLVEPAPTIFGLKNLCTQTQALADTIGV